MKKPVSQQKSLLAQKLTGIIEQLMEESSHWLETPEDQQLWYNRGYADGMVKAMQELGLEHLLTGQATHPLPDEFEQHRWMPWGKAYLHGHRMAYQETLDVLGDASAAPKQTIVRPRT